MRNRLVITMCLPLLTLQAAGDAGQQDSKTSEPMFEEGEPRSVASLFHLHQRSSIPPQYKVAAVFETRPALNHVPSSAGDADAIMRAALGIVLGWKNERLPIAQRSISDLKGNQASVEHEWALDGQPAVIAGDRWIVLAVDAETAKSMVRALLTSFRDHLSDKLTVARKEIGRNESESGRLRASINELNERIAKIEEQCAMLGADQVNLASVDEAITRFDQEFRLNEIDIAGLQAALASAAARTAATTTQKAGPPGSQDEIMRTLCRIQVELEIQLVGKMARKESLSREQGQLRKARDARKQVEDLQSQFTFKQKLADSVEKSIKDQNERIASLEELLHAADARQVTISSIAAKDP